MLICEASTEGYSLENNIPAFFLLFNALVNCYYFQRWFEHRLARWRQQQGLPANSGSVNDWTSGLTGTSTPHTCVYLLIFNAIQRVQKYPFGVWLHCLSTFFSKYEVLCTCRVEHKSLVLANCILASNSVHGVYVCFRVLTSLTITMGDTIVHWLSRLRPHGSSVFEYLFNPECFKLICTPSLAS